MSLLTESTNPDIGADDLLQIAAWLDGRLDETRASDVEWLLAGDRDLLERVLALRELHAEPVAAGELLRAQALVQAAPPRLSLRERWAALGGVLAARQPAPMAVGAMMTVVVMAGSLWLGSLASQELSRDELANLSMQQVTQLDFTIGDGGAAE